MEQNIAIIPIHSRYFAPYLKIVQNTNLEILVAAVIDGDAEEWIDKFATIAIIRAPMLEVKERGQVFVGIQTLDVYLFPD
jgi:putative ATP-dependent endonuclease of OLD family